MAAASKILNLRTSALHNLICRHLLRPSAAASNLLSSISNQSLNLFLTRNGDAESPVNSPIPYFNLPQCPLGSSLVRIEAARTYVTADDHDYDDSDDDEDDSDEDELDDDDLENYSGSDFDDEDEYEDSDQDPDIK